MAASILIADDDAVQRRLVDNILQKCGYETIVVDSGDAAIAALMTAAAPAIDAVVLDLVMPGLDGMGVLIKIREAGLNIPVIVQTAHGGIDNVVSAMRAGAQDFVVKPAGIERLQVSLRNALNASALKGELQRIRHSREGRLTFADIITRSESMTGVVHIAQKAAASTIPVLIEGESGVGKELFARAIHGSSERKSKPFVAVNCGAIPDNLVESILFGHEKGAFTGATDRHTGKFVEASGGTLFLDEISELPLAAQVKLLRALQEGAVEAVGGRKPVKVDVRIISATNRKLLDRANSEHSGPLIVAPAFHSTVPAMISGSDIPIVPQPSAGTLVMLTNAGEIRALEELESEIIRFAISHYRGQMSEVARRLKIGRSTLYRKLDEGAAAGDPSAGGAADVR